MTRGRVRWSASTARWAGAGVFAHVVPATGTVAILLTQVAADSPAPPGWLRDFWRLSATWSD